MNIVYNILAAAAGIFVGYILKLAVNWLRIDEYKIRGHIYTLEIICGVLFLWSFLNMPINEAIIFPAIVTGTTVP